MQKKNIVRLTEQQRNELTKLLRKNDGPFQKLRRARILLKADADGPAWSDQRIAEAFDCSKPTVANVRRKFVQEGFTRSLCRKKRDTPPTPSKLDGQQQAQVIAMRLGDAPEGYGTWSLRLLADRIVELNIVESISHETVRKTLKKME